VPSRGLLTLKTVSNERPVMLICAPVTFSVKERFVDPLGAADA
jgi:hypothetical protein